MKHPKTKFHAQTMSNSQDIMPKKVKLSLGQLYLAAQFFYHQYFIETTTIEFDMFLQFLVQFCNYSEFVASSDIIMLFCPLLGNWILCICRLCVVRQEMSCHSTWF